MTTLDKTLITNLSDLDMRDSIDRLYDILSEYTIDLDDLSLVCAAVLLKQKLINSSGIKNPNWRNDPPTDKQLELLEAPKM